MNEFLNDLRKKYGYDNDLITAIEITINLMLEKYGEDQRSEIYRLFDSTEIFPLKEIKDETVKPIQERKAPLNPHVKVVEPENPYGSSGYASLYCYDQQFDENMKVVDETSFIIIQDMKGRFNEDGYRRLFGTSINMPYFIHEANHAYAMMHPEFIYDGNTIYSKHGMHTSVFYYTQDLEGNYTLYQDSSNDVILEEMINERITQEMLVSFFIANDYKEVDDLLNEIHHVGTSYNSLLMSLGEKLEKLLGSESLMDYRRNNNYSHIEKFNEVAKKGEVALEYLGDKVPFDYFREQVFGIFNLKVNQLKYSIEAYGYESAKLMLKAFAPLIAYQEVEFQNISLEDFNKTRDNIFAQYPQHRGNGLD